MFGSGIAGANWVAIAGILGTLGGVIIGSFFTYKIQARQIAHEDSTRFHDLRMEKYAEFTSWANHAMAYYLMGQHDFDASMKFQKTFSTVRLVASMAVVEKAMAVHTLFGNLQAKAIAKEKLPPTETDAFSDAIVQFTREARKELKTD